MALSQIKNTMSELYLRGMLLSLDQTLTEATKESWSYTELLDSLLQAEYDYKEKKRIDRRIHSSKLKRRFSFEGFDYTAQRSITKIQIKELLNLRWIEQGRSIVLMGPTGIGKTFLAEAIGMHVCQNKHSVLFLSISTFLENLLLARAAGNYLKMRDRLTKPRVLILDDFGLKKLSTKEAHDLCEILEERSIDRSTVVTTQLPLENWTEVIEDPIIADAIIDRLKHTSIKLTITGESYRKVKAKELDALMQKA